MPKWNVRRRPGRMLGLLLLAILSFLVLRRVNWPRLTPLWLRHRRLGLQAKGQNFMLEDSAFWIFGGSVHYFRVPREYWRDRLLKMKACGLNTLTTYVPWNLHEPARGRFDFSGNLDLEAFVLLAAEVGLWVILRPGPYICSEMDLGGLPSWLLQDPDMRLRTTYKGFTEAVDLYFDHLMARVVPLQYKHGGPIIAVQVENEYGSYNKDPAYMPYVKKALEDRGIVELLLTSDNKDGLSKGIVDGALATINLQSQNELQFLTTFLLSVQGVQPRMVMECWTGWFDSWGGPHSILDSSEVLETVSAIVDSGSSINLYMFHGGTNFGFISGAVHLQDYKSDVTSYDYDAVLTESGDYTAKYTGLREFFGSISGAPLPAPPDLLPKTAYEPVMPALYLSLWDALPYLEEPVTSEKPLNMENLPINGGNGQSFGYTLYETTITSSGILSACVRDRGQVFVNTVSIGFLDYKRKKIVIPLVQGFTVLRILVENCGRVNYGTNIDDQRKGLSFFPEELAVLATLASSVLLGAERMAAWPWSQALPEECSPVLWKGSGFTSRRPPLQSRVHPLHLHLQFRRVCSPLNTPSLSGLPVWRLSSSVTERTQDTQWAPPRGAGKSLFKCVQCLSLGCPGHGAVCSQFKYLKKNL
ncbi:beta-galactosidase-1-like protein 2 isoform X3 [Balaenoptera musculus]|uniref:Beta-galactosidase n=1 Tax=Balaenoptera musculus TaxID=9771 RepID=A0A8C0D299_BALMU|nr:beta-galactosidase-1-like protein 2 isoform X3 [Balaenoptera musculus]